MNILPISKNLLDFDFESEYLQAPRILLPFVITLGFSGLVYAGIGWVVFRNREALQEDLIFTTNYLGSDQPNITLNFSRGASNIVAQYYQFLRLGWNGYHSVMKNLMFVRYLIASHV